MQQGGNGGEDLPKEQQPIDYTVGCPVPIALSSPLCGYRRLQTERVLSRKKPQICLCCSVKIDPVCHVCLFNIHNTNTASCVSCRSLPSRATNCGVFLFRPRRAWFPSSLLSVIVHICQSIPLSHTLNHWSKTTIGDGDQQQHQHQNNKSWLV